jgi:hypothetical protein
MARGLKIPFQVGPHGGAAITESDEQAFKVIRLALSDNDNDNAFQQDIGLGQAMIFSTRNASFRAKVIARLFKVFATFEVLKLYKLDKSTLKWRTEKAGEQILEFKFINLESDKVETFTHSFATARSGT